MIVSIFFCYWAWLEGNFICCVRARANLRALMTQKSCAVGMRNATLRNHLKMFFQLLWKFVANCFYCSSSKCLYTIQPGGYQLKLHWITHTSMTWICPLFLPPNKWQWMDACELRHYNSVQSCNSEFNFVTYILHKNCANCT